MQEYIYIIIGGGMAGGSAVDAIREKDAKGSIALVTQESHRPYQRPPLSKRYLRGEIGKDKVYLHSQEYYGRQNVDLYLGAEVVELLPGTRYVILDDGRKLQYSKLLLATGGRAKRLSFPGNDLPGVFTLRSIEDSQAIHQAGGHGKHALVLGGSFIGAEAASSLSQMGAKVTMIFPEKRLLERIVPNIMSEFLHSLYADHDVRILPETTLVRLEAQDGGKKAYLDNKEVLDVDLVVMGVGIQLNTGLALDGDLEVLEMNEEGAILVDETLCTSEPHIYAAGDIAAWPDPTFGQRLRVEHWDVAKSQGRCAGLNMTGEYEAYTKLPYFFSDLFDISFNVWGDLSNWDRVVTRGSLDKRSFAFFYFNDNRMVAVLAVGRPAQERVPMQALVKNQSKYEEAAEALRDESLDLAELSDVERRVDQQAPEEKERKMAELSFKQDIRPLFRDKDIEEMKDISGYDLSKYEDVKPRADGIYARILDESMPCDGPWPEEQIEKFKQWIDQGMKP
jgi:NADPH-dependent 2,4-dienoyl-CoA reductase/sulfur reductase-like enzyme